MNTKTAEEMTLEQAFFKVNEYLIVRRSTEDSNFMFIHQNNVHDVIESIYHGTVSPLKKRIEELEAQTTLYGVHNFSWDGGGSNSTLYRNKEDAEKELRYDVYKAQLETDDVYKDCPDEAPERWHEIEGGIWTDGSNNMSVRTYTLHPSTNGKQD